MRECTIEIRYKTCTVAELPEADRPTVEAARMAVNTAHAPFSGFSVGAAALLDDGTIITASNQESEVFPSGMCAERALLYRAMTMMPQRKIVTITIASRTSEGLSNATVYPCGACLQTLADAEIRQNQPIKIVMTSAAECAVMDGVSALMPFRFTLTK